MSFLVRDPGLAPGLCLYPKQVGRYLPMSLEWSGWRDSNSRFPAPEAGGLAATLQPGVFLGELDVRIEMLRLLRADRAGDRKILEAFAPHPVMVSEEAKSPGEPSPLRPLSPGRFYIWHPAIVALFFGVTDGDRTRTLWATTRCANHYTTATVWSARQESHLRFSLIKRTFCC